MPSKHYHEIVVGNLGTVYSGNSTGEAKDKYSSYKKLSALNVGTVTGEPVTWMRNGEVYKEYQKKEPVKRIHNEYFSSVSMGGRKSCPACHNKLEPGESIWAWYEYVRVTKRLIAHCCKNCFKLACLPRLLSHQDDCGCSFNLSVQVGFNEQRPEWLTL